MTDSISNTVEYVVSTPLYLNSSLTLYQCGWENCRAGHTFGPAVRPHYLFHYILSGKGTFTSCGKQYQLSAGQGFLICPGDSTVYSADEQDPWKYCWFGFDGYETPSILERCGLSLNTPIFIDHSHGELQENLKKLIGLFEHSKLNEYEAIGQLYLIFSKMLKAEKESTKTFDKSYADKAVDFIRHNYSYDIRISDIARYIGIDRTYLYRIFRQVHCISPQQYLIQFRLHVACTLLEKSAMTITEIAYSCGFQDTPAFYKHFKSRYASTPSEYRSKHKGAISL